MKPVYASIQPTTGPQVAGICTVRIIPIEWLQFPFEIDFATNTVLYLPMLIEGKDWITLSLVQPTFEYKETQKTSKGGSYYEIELTGLSNNMEPETLQTLETLRYHKFVAIVQVRSGREKIVGNIDAGLDLQFSNSETNTDGGTQVVELQLTMESENVAPFLNA